MVAAAAAECDRGAGNYQATAAKELLIQGSGVVTLNTDPASHDLYSGRILKPQNNEVHTKKVEILQ